MTCPYSAIVQEPKFGAEHQPIGITDLNCSSNTQITDLVMFEGQRVTRAGRRTHPYKLGWPASFLGLLKARPLPAFSFSALVVVGSIVRLLILLN